MAGAMIGTPGRLTENPGFVGASAQQVSGTPHAWRLAVCALERASEGFLGIVADPAGDDADAEIGRRQQVFREVHPPFGEVPDRRPAEHVAEQIGRDTSELQSPCNLVCRLLLEKKKKKI